MVGREILENVGELKEGNGDDQENVKMKNKQWIFLYSQTLKLETNT